jgi:glycosyltransferase involved in cell wall biosynthesis
MKVSIITPSYRQLAYLKLCVASVADQAEVDVEHIIQDAGTGDDLEVWVRSRPNVRLYVESDKGMYDAINRGLQRAHGEICGYLNCDEQYLPGALAKAISFFETHPEVEVLFGDVVLVNRKGEPLSYRRSVLPTKRHVQLAHLNTPTCATFFRQELLDRGFYFDPRWKAIGDAVWMEKLLMAKIRMATLPEPLAVFTFTGENLGETLLSSSESRQWKRESSIGNRLTKLGAVFWHRVRKTMAGAYRPRRIEVDIFTLESPERRQHFIKKIAGFGWPLSQ